MRVVVADDVMLTREGIVRLLEDAGVDVVAEAENADELLRHVRLSPARRRHRRHPHATDTHGRGSRRGAAIRAEHPEVGVLVLSQYVEPSYALRLLEEHPERVGYLLKERVFDVAILVDASAPDRRGRDRRRPDDRRHACSGAAVAKTRSPS